MSASHAQALYFGAEGEQLFGWLHRPAPGSLAGLGLVICNPYGFEDVCAHRSLRQLAEAAAAVGIPTLRFDYAGCGNSVGDEFDADVVGRWTRSVHQAIDCLRHASGVAQVALVGVRLGAALATGAAVQRDDVAGLVAVAPVVRGRAWLREFAMLAQAGAAPPGSAGEDDGRIESAGFVLTRETSQALAAIDLRALRRRPADRVLIVERDDLPTTDDWSPALQRLGAEVVVARWGGYAGMMDDPQRCIVPLDIVDGIVRQLQAWQATTSLRQVQAEPVGVPTIEGPARETAGTAIRERVVRIDTASSTLFGVLTSPLAGTPGADGPAVLMLNSGSVRLIGPNRLWVRLARRWAARGMTVLRVDLSGIGDSAPRPGAEGNVVYSPHALADIESALAFLKTEAPGRDCRLVGLCSGAYHSLKAAVAGQAVSTALMINPLTYFWHDGDELSEVHDYEVAELTSRYRGKLFTWEPWGRLIRGELDMKLIAQVATRRVSHAMQPLLLELARRMGWPLKDDLVADLRSATRHGIHLRFVFGSSAAGLTLLQRQAGRWVRGMARRREASIDLIAQSDHTFTRLEARERLVRLLDGLIASPDPR